MTRPRRHGFVLFEATAALFVVTVGIFGLVQLFQSVTGELRAVQEHELAGRILRNEIETVLAYPFDEIAPGTGLPFRSTPPELDRLVRAQAGVDVRDSATRPGRLKEVSVRIDWISTHGRRVHRELTTLVARSDAP